MKKWAQLSGLSSGLPFKVDATWTPEQALAVLQLIDDLSDRIWTHYGGAVQNLLREQHAMDGAVDEYGNDVPF